MTFAGQVNGAGRYEIARLKLGRLTVPAGTPMGGVSLPVNAYLIKHPRGVILFDTGLGAEHAWDEQLAPIERYSMDDALAAQGVERRDVVAVVNSHLHYDHSGGNPMFAGVPIYVQAAEYAARTEMSFVVTERIDFPGADLRLVNGEEEVAAGVRLIATPGHTPGQSVASG